MGSGWQKEGDPGSETSYYQLLGKVRNEKRY